MISKESRQCDLTRKKLERLGKLTKGCISLGKENLQWSFVLSVNHVGFFCAKTCGQLSLDKNRSQGTYENLRELTETQLSLSAERKVLQKQQLDQREKTSVVAILLLCFWCYGVPKKKNSLIVVVTYKE